MKKVLLPFFLSFFSCFSLHAKTINWETNRWVNSLGINMTHNLEYVTAMDKDYNLNFIIGFPTYPHEIGKNYSIDVSYGDYSSGRITPAYMDVYLLWNFLKPDKFRFGALAVIDSVTFCSLEAWDPVHPGEVLYMNYGNANLLLSGRIAYAYFFHLTAGMLFTVVPFYEKDLRGDTLLSWYYNSSRKVYDNRFVENFYFLNSSWYDWSAEVHLNSENCALSHFTLKKSFDFVKTGIFSPIFTYDLFMETLRAGFELSGMNPVTNLFINAGSWFDIHKNIWCLWLGNITLTEKYYFLTGEKPHSGLFIEAGQSITADVLKELMPGFMARISAENILLSFAYSTLSIGFSYNYSTTLYTAPVKDDFIWIFGLDMTI